VASSAPALLQIVGATAGALWQGENILPFGHWPDGERGAVIVALMRRNLRSAIDDVFSTDHAALLLALESGELSSVCGLMALRLDPGANAGIIWLRSEFRHQIDWGGDPEHPTQVTLDPSGVRTQSPRASFERWKHEVQGRCRPWDDTDLAAARLLLPLQQALVLRATFAQIDVGEQRFSELVALQSETYWQTDQLGRLVLLSKPLPGQDGPAEGLTLPELLASSCDATSTKTLADAFTGKAPMRALRLRGSVPGGVTFELQLNGERMTDRLGHSAGWHGTLVDVTQEAAAQTARLQRDAAEQANIAKSRFLSHVTHELQTPLTTVVGFSELLLLDDALSATQREPLMMIQKAGTWLQAMIADLLDLSRIETGNLRVTLAPTEIRAVLDETMALVRFEAEAKEVGFVLDEQMAPVTVRADAVRLKQVLLNLATNAIKYSNASSEVRIAVTVDRSGKRADIEVRDTGMGMSAAQCESLFQPFNRLGRENGQIPGTGIGLALARHLVDAMGGKLGVTSEPGKGSCFSVSLAVVPEEVPLHAS
jgi:light-regulated signal transduction histidine kinase (bacteriophytochrome)